MISAYRMTLSLTVMLTAATAVNGQQCEAMRRSGPEEQMEFLREHRGSENRECIAYGLMRLGEEKYVPAVDLIAEFLDFEWSKKAPVPITRIPWLGDRYPAATAL